MARVCTVVLRGHLTARALDSALKDAAKDLAAQEERAALVIDADEMTGYDNDARALFVSWNEAHRDRIAAVAVVTTNTLWVMVIAAMSLASRQKMKGFATRAAALAWCAAA